MSFASTIANRAALATRVVSQVSKSSNNTKRRSLIVKAEGDDVPAETEKPAAAAPVVRFLFF